MAIGIRFENRPSKRQKNQIQITMIINFNITRQNEHGQIEYFNSRGQVVKSYDLSNIMEFLKKKYNSYSLDYISDILDFKWIELTEAFYMAMNPHEYQSNNRPQETKKV